MTQGFTFSVPTHVTFGAGCRREIFGLLTRHGWDGVGVVVDHGLRGSPAVQQLLTDLGQAVPSLATLWCEIAEPTYDSLERARRQFEGQPVKAVIGIGGGSALDMAKAMAALVRNRRPAVEYRGFNKMSEPVLPIVAVPTTAGTGSEVTPNASFIDSHERRKLGINGEAMRPIAAFLDPELTLTCPPRATLSAAVDSLVHATEAYVAKKSTPIARLFAREGFHRVITHLPGVMRDPGNLTDRTEVMYGALLAGVALMHSGTGPAAALSYPAGVHHQVPHGVGGGIFLPHVVKHNVASGVTDYADLYQVMPGSDTRRSRAEQAQGFADGLFATWQVLGVPRLSEFGVSAEHLNRFVADTLQLSGALEQNPAPFGEAEIRAAVVASL